MGIYLLGMSHHSAPLDLRERVVYSRAEAIDALRGLKRDERVGQALLISTCNRTELYAHAPEEDNLPGRLGSRIFLERVGEHAAAPPPWLYLRKGPQAVEHLFRVACGLDSMVLGEQQILGQVKTAYEVSQEANTVGTVLHKLAARAFRIGKRARSETRIGAGAVSVAFAAVELAQKVFQSLEGRGVLVVGAGENGRLLAEHLLARRVRPLLITSRTRANAERLAEDLGGETLPMESLVDAMARVDIVVSTTGSPTPVITREMVREAMSRRSRGEMILIDVAVPRDIEPEVDDVGGVMRFDIDAIRNIVDQNLARRAGEIPKVEKLVRTETEMFMNWLGTLDASPTIRALHETFEKVRIEEIGKHSRRFSEEDREQLDVFTRNLLRKVLMDVTREIKGYHLDVPEEAERLATLRQLFHLPDPTAADEEESFE